LDGLERNISNISKVSTNVTIEKVLNIDNKQENFLENLQINRTNEKMNHLQQSATSDVTSVSKSANTNSNEDRISS
jgi:hypothetical protein